MGDLPGRTHPLAAADVQFSQEFDDWLMATKWLHLGIGSGARTSDARCLSLPAASSAFPLDADPPLGVDSTRHSSTANSGRKGLRPQGCRRRGDARMGKPHQETWSHCRGFWA